ncbi:DUF983 domain-containing protein [Hymenobacter yonginensis]|uniref:DUF983 domain-containing protein n=1 Tax=Hymenobacter yonginensis TaxID=748197 RepID=A0ABY7PK35_9BACT|nr:DUF983 domain-containing protein [Hymenobacter yonginensis]WBO83017.1 DUF983 domain-containing protein [Hymenobacter yonginensis]
MSTPATPPATPNTDHDSTLLAMVQQRCPRCHQGPLFTHPALSTKFMSMPAQCPVCSQAYEPEPGFYWGAMYISFVFSTGIMLVIGFAVYFLLNDPDTWVYIVCVAVVSLLFTPLSLRYSRTLMLYLFGGIQYRPDRAHTNAR